MFKPGDKVECVDDGNLVEWLKTGEVYTVSSFVPAGEDFTEDVLYLEEDPYGEWYGDWWLARRFKLAE